MLPVKDNIFPFFFFSASVTVLIALTNKGGEKKRPGNCAATEVGYCLCVKVFLQAQERSGNSDTHFCPVV